MSDPVSQSLLIQNLVNKALYEKKFKEAKEGLDFMSKYLKEEQWSLCRKRILDTIQRLVKIFQEKEIDLKISLNRPNQILFPSWKSQFGSDRIAITIGPDTYCSHFMEICLLRPDNQDFLDRWGYQNQDTKEFDNFEDLLEEVLRIWEIYKKI